MNFPIDDDDFNADSIRLIYTIYFKSISLPRFHCVHILSKRSKFSIFSFEREGLENLQYLWICRNILMNFFISVHSEQQCNLNLFLFFHPQYALFSFSPSNTKSYVYWKYAIFIYHFCMCLLCYFIHENTYCWDYDENLFCNREVHFIWKIISTLYVAWKVQIEISRPIYTCIEL